MMSLFKKYYYSFQIDNNLSQIFQDNIRAFVFFRKDFNLLKYEDLGMILFSLNNNVSCFVGQTIVSDTRLFFEFMR